LGNIFNSGIFPILLLIGLRPIRIFFPKFPPDRDQAFDMKFTGPGGVESVKNTG